MVVKTDYSHDVNGYTGLLIKTSDKHYDLFYPKCLDNGTTKLIVRKLCKVSIDFTVTPPTWGSVTEIDVETPSGFTNPQICNRPIVGYNFDNGEVLIVLGEWQSGKVDFECVQVKLLGVNRTTGVVTVRQSDLLALAKTIVSAVDRLWAYAGFCGYDGKLVGTLGALVGAPSIPNERSIIALYNGTTWSAINPKPVQDGVQEQIEPIFDSADAFIGWLTEGHGTNSVFVKPDLSWVGCKPPNTLYTTEPVYDPVNHKVIWIEWGATSATQRVHEADPSAVYGCINFVDKTPSGTITDNEANNINLSTVNKSSGAVFSDGTNYWLVCGVYMGGLVSGVGRSLKADLGYLNDPTKWACIADPSNNDKREIWGRNRALDPTTKKLLTIPMIITNPQSA